MVIKEAWCTTCSYAGKFKNCEHLYTWKIKQYAVNAVYTHEGLMETI